MSSSFVINPFPGITKRSASEDAITEGSAVETISTGFDALIAQVESGKYVPGQSAAAKAKAEKPKQRRAPAKRKKPTTPKDDVE